MPLALQPLPPKYINQLYERVESSESVFRNILVDLSGNENEADFFRHESLENIFNQYVRVSGYKIRVSDFRVGPFTSDEIPGYKFPQVDPSTLEQDDALVLVERSNDSLIKIYKVSEDSSVKAIRSEHYHQY